MEQTIVMVSCWIVGFFIGKFGYRKYLRDSIKAELEDLREELRENKELWHLASARLATIEGTLQAMERTVFFCGDYLHKEHLGSQKNSTVKPDN